MLNIVQAVLIWGNNHFQGRIQDSEGGGFVHSEGGGGGSYRNFRSGSKLLQGPGQINKQNKIADSRRGGGVPMTPKKPLYPRMTSGHMSVYRGRHSVHPSW